MELQPVATILVEMLDPWPSACWKPRGGKASSLGMGNEEGTGGLTMITNFSGPTIHEDRPGRGLRETHKCAPQRTVHCIGSMLRRWM